MEIPSSEPTALAREVVRRLHEDACQFVSSAALKAAVLEKRLKAGEPADLESVGEIRASLHEAAERLRTLMSDLGQLESR